MFKVPVEKHGGNGHLRQKGKIAELALGYGGSVGALKAMGAIEMGLTEDELPPLVQAWRQTNPHIVKFWWDIDRAVMQAVKYKQTSSCYGLTCSATRPSVSGSTKEDSTEVQTETLSITATPLPSGLVKVKTGTNTSEETYNNWYSAVYQPQAAANVETPATGTVE